MKQDVSRMRVTSAGRGTIPPRPKHGTRINTNTSSRPRTTQTPNPGKSANTGKIDQGRGASRRTGRDFKTKYLKESLIKMEMALGVRKGGSNGRCVNGDLPISEFVPAFQGYIKSLNMAERQKQVVALQSGLTSYQMVFNYFRCYREVRVSFDGFEGLNDVVQVLQMFKFDIDDVDTTGVSSPRPGRHRVKAQKIRQLNKVFTVLNLVDAKSSKARNTNYGYRFLRLFCMCVIRGDFVTASVLADTLLDQMVLEQRIKYRKVD